jgi:Cupin-like domain
VRLTGIAARYNINMTVDNLNALCKKRSSKSDTCMTPVTVATVNHGSASEPHAYDAADIEPMEIESLHSFASRQCPQWNAGSAEPSHVWQSFAVPKFSWGKVPMHRFATHMRHMFRGVGITAGCGAYSKSLQFSTNDQIITAFEGEFTLRLIAPWHSSSAYLSEDMPYSSADLFSPDTRKFSRLDDSQYLETELTPGTSVFIPAFWIYQIQTKSTRSSLVDFRFTGNSGVQFVPMMHSFGVPEADIARLFAGHMELDRCMISKDIVGCSRIEDIVIRAAVQVSMLTRFARDKQRKWSGYDNPEDINAKLPLPDTYDLPQLSGILLREPFVFPILPSSNLPAVVVPTVHSGEVDQDFGGDDDDDEEDDDEEEEEEEEEEEQQQQQQQQQEQQDSDDQGDANNGGTTDSSSADASAEVVDETLSDNDNNDSPVHTEL